jgi:hypothetical protein
VETQPAPETLSGEARDPLLCPWKRQHCDLRKSTGVDSNGSCACDNRSIAVAGRLLIKKWLIRQAHHASDKLLVAKDRVWMPARTTATAIVSKTLIRCVRSCPASKAKRESRRHRVFGARVLRPGALAGERT